ncbi:MAG: adenylate kinase [Candidatus Omnitrophica bacterium]|nr:adenylate kinase [Candidatus Omnitrophota bacterium]
MRIILLGAPGAGKGTLATAIKAKLGVLHISTGDLLREELKNKTPLGLEAKKFIEAGTLVPDSLVIQLIENKLAASDIVKGYMLDGFPRNKAQAEALDAMMTKRQQPVDIALYLEASLPVVLQRLTGRRVCRACGAVFHLTNMPPRQAGVCDACGGELYQRTDDNEETIKKRMDVFLDTTRPMIEYYRAQNKLVTVNADQESTEVVKAALKLFS